MSLAAPIPEIVRPEIVRPEIVRPNAAIPKTATRKTEARSSAPAIRTAWFEVRAQDLAVWNGVLLDTATSLYQYPFWNEPYRPLWLTPRYMAWGTEDRPLAFVSILTIGFGPAKIGLVFRGPSSLHPEFHFTQPAIQELLDWARAEGYVFIRFTHSDPEILTQLAAAGHAEDFDAFPYFLDYPVQSPDYIVEQFDCEEATLAGFDREARRKLRRASEAGYEFRADDSPEALAQAWPLYQDCARRKHFRLERPLSVYQETIRLAQAHDCVRVYSAHLNGKMVGSTLVFRDRTIAHSLLACFDADHRHAAVFLHWRAMRDMYRLGARRYNLGPGPGSLARFKQQFCETPVAYPAALTVVLNQSLFQIWRKVIFPIAKGLRPTLRKIVSHIKR
jgi:hypothetical protein